MKRRKIILKTVFITLLFALITFIILYNIGVKISRNMLLDYEYKEYYIYKYDYTKFSWWSDPCNSPPALSRIWFLPFQKKSLLNKLQKDVCSLLEDFKKSNESSTIDYVISDDFKKVIIYVDNPHQISESPDYIKLKYEVIDRILLYQDLLHGYDSLYFGDIIKLTYI